MRIAFLGTRLIGLSFAVLFAACDMLGPKEEGEDATHTGTISGQFNWTTTARVTCTSTYTVTGTIWVRVERSASNVTGEGSLDVVEVPGPPREQGCGPAPNRNFGGGSVLSGTESQFGFSDEYTSRGVLTETTRMSFTGALVGDVVNGTVTIQHSGSGIIQEFNTTTAGTGTFAVTLRPK